MDNPVSYWLQGKQYNYTMQEIFKWKFRQDIAAGDIEAGQQVLAG